MEAHVFGTLNRFYLCNVNVFDYSRLNRIKLTARELYISRCESKAGKKLAEVIAKLWQEPGVAASGKLCHSWVGT